MRIPKDGYLLRIYLGEADRWHGQPLYEAIVTRARAMHLAGATVLRGSLGFGAKSHLHRAKMLVLSEDLPILVEIVDTRENIDRFLPVIDEMLPDGLVTLERVQVIQYRANSAPPDNTQPE
jgi:hypothetical protein